MARGAAAITELRRALGDRLATFRKAAGVTQAALAAATYCDRTRVAHIEKGRARADEPFWQVADQVTVAGGQLLSDYRALELARHEYDERSRSHDLAAVRSKAEAMRSTPLVSWATTPSSDDDELAALELLRRVSASDVGNETLTQLEHTVDDLAMAYPVTPPVDLLARLRSHLSYINALLDSRMTLAERQRLVVVGAWLSLVAATVHVDFEATGSRQRPLAYSIEFG